MDLTIPGLVHRYADAVCRRDADQWASCWTDDAVWVLDPQRRVQGREPIVVRWRIEMAKYRAVIQLVANGDASEDGDHATGRWYIHEYNRRADGSSAILVAYYDDVYEHTGSGWLFARRELTRLYQGAPDLAGSFVEHDQ
ncbi:MAG TPA: nuclear transport factor 2 family protein [Acidimicrobiales bacterium]